MVQPKGAQNKIEAVARKRQGMQIALVIFVVEMRVHAFCLPKIGGVYVKIGCGYSHRQREYGRARRGVQYSCHPLTTSLQAPYYSLIHFRSFSRIRQRPIMHVIARKIRGYPAVIGIDEPFVEFSASAGHRGQYSSHMLSRRINHVAYRPFCMHGRIRHKLAFLKLYLSAPHRNIYNSLLLRHKMIYARINGAFGMQRVIDNELGDAHWLFLASSVYPLCHLIKRAITIRKVKKEFL